MLQWRSSKRRVKEQAEAHKKKTAELCKTTRQQHKEEIKQQAIVHKKKVKEVYERKEMHKKKTKKLYERIKLLSTEIEMKVEPIPDEGDEEKGADGKNRG